MSNSMMMVGRLMSVSVALLGAWTLAGWWLKMEGLVRPLAHHTAMVPNTALCLLLAAVALLISVDGGPRVLRIRLGLIFAGLVLTSLVAMSYASGFAGVDALLAKIWIADNNPLPGRMAIQSIACLLALYIVILLLQCRRGPATDAAVHLLLTFTIIVCSTSLIGYVVDIPFLYTWFRATSIAGTSAAGLLVLAVAAAIHWLHLRKTDRTRALPSNETARLFVTTALATVLFAISLIGLIVLYVSVNRVQMAGLQNTAKIQARAVREELQAVDTATDSIAGRPYLVSQLKLINRGEATEATMAAIKRAINSIVIKNVTGMSIHALNGDLIAHQGEPEKPSSFDVALDYSHRLRWDEAPVLRRTIQMLSDGQLVATATVDIRLPNIGAVMQDSYAFGPSAETSLCGHKDTNTVVCLPQRHRPFVAHTGRVRDGQTLPIGRALDGTTGLVHAIDYRRQAVAAAFAPVTPYPLGIVSKIDRADLSPLIERQFTYVLATLFVLLAAIIVGHHFLPVRFDRQPVRLKEAA